MATETILNRGQTRFSVEELLMHRGILLTGVGGVPVGKESSRKERDAVLEISTSF